MEDNRSLTSNERLLYYCICLFCLIACFTTLLDFMYLRLLSKGLQVFILGLIPILLIIIKDKNRSNKKLRIIKLSLFISIFEIILFFVSIFYSSEKVPFNFIFQSFLQIFFIYFWIYTSFSINDLLLNKILLFLKKVFFFGVLISIIELIIPNGVKSVILNLVYGSIPPNYLSRDLDFGLMRLGSFYLNPLTFSYTLLFLVCCSGLLNNSTKSKYLYLFMALIAQTKTAFLGGIFMLLGHKMKNILIAILILSISLVIFLCVYFDGWFFYYMFDGTSLKSLSNHLSGLVFGINAGIKDLWGNGLGKSGFLIYVLAQTYNVDMSTLYEVTLYERGDESTLGIISYQLGGIFLLLHTLLFIKIFFYHIRNQSYSIASFILIIILFQIFSESPLTIIITFSQAFLFAKLHNENNHEDSNY